MAPRLCRRRGGVSLRACDLHLHETNERTNRDVSSSCGVDSSQSAPSQSADVYRAALTGVAMPVLVGYHPSGCAPPGCGGSCGTAAIAHKAACDNAPPTRDAAYQQVYTASCRACASMRGRRQRCAIGACMLAQASHGEHCNARRSSVDRSAPLPRGLRQRDVCRFARSIESIPYLQGRNERGRIRSGTCARRTGCA